MKTDIANAIDDSKARSDAQRELERLTEKYATLDDLWEAIRDGKQEVHDFLPVFGPSPKDPADVFSWDAARWIRVARRHGDGSGEDSCGFVLEPRDDVR